MVDSRENESNSSRSDRPEVRVHVFGRTDVGMVREHNEDNFLIADLSQKNRSLQPEVQKHTIGEYGTVFAVCDGMGGAAAGEVASRIGVDTIYERLQLEDAPASDEDLARRMDEAVCEAGRRIHAESKANSARRGMGTTATVAVLRSDRLIFGQVGDSRAHIIRSGALVQTTKDQSLVQQLLDANQLTPEEAKNFDRSNIILQALGTSEEVHVDLTSVQLRKGDILVICSDGLSGMVEPEDIRDVVLSIESPMEACQKLTQMACDNGGDDNVTVIVAKFDGPGLVPPTANDRLGYEKYIVASVDDDDEESTMSIRGGARSLTASGGLNSPSPSGKSAAHKLPMLVLITALAMIGLVVGFSLSNNDGNGDSEAGKVPPPVAVSPNSDGDSTGSRDVPDEDSSSDADNADVHENANDSTGPAGKGEIRSSAGDEDVNDDADDASASRDREESTDSSDEESTVGVDDAEVDTETDSTASNRSDGVGDASAEEDNSDDNAESSEGKWSRTKSDRKRVSEDEQAKEEDTENMSTVEQNPY
ncbi:MAG: protein phosphatase 2C domain-containing protein [Deltaproteobacteria bacterium]|nr:protein phosphatase 2C domain-containing protein [Deltaproteobacteria bacterium]MBN2673635.1 protein phosphatase 2C domain-containing protein [Deltaproteobacteria bacterium]